MKYSKIILFLIILAMFCGVVSATTCALPYTDYGNGVLYFYKSSQLYPSFGCDYPEPGARISQYLIDHPEKHIVSMVADAFVGYGNTGGFYVIVENKSIETMSCIPIWDGARVGTTAIVNYTCTASGK
jgi:hypothetical protein